MAAELAQGEVHHADLHLGNPPVDVFSGAASDRAIVAEAPAQFGLRSVESKTKMPPRMRPSHAGEGKQRVTKLLFHCRRICGSQELVDLGQQVSPQLLG
jgi:hypothetical protein